MFRVGTRAGLWVGGNPIDDEAVQRDEIPHIRLGTNIRFHY